MDLISSEENDTPLIIDSGTESIIESPTAEDESDHSEDSTVCDIQIASKTKEKLQTSHSILDKSFSIDEEDLATPLEPTPVVNYPTLSSISSNGASTDSSSSDPSGKSDDEEILEEELAYNDCVHETEIEGDPGEGTEKQIDSELSGEEKKNEASEDGSVGPGGDAPSYLTTIPEYTTETEISTGTNNQIYLPNTSYTSILRGQPTDYDSSLNNSSTNSKRRVSFPPDDCDLIRYCEPDHEFPWMITQDMPAEKILQVYQNSCKKHKTVELDVIKSQISEIKNNTNHSAVLKLNSVKITSEVNETLEDLLKVTNFHTLILHDCKFTPETMTEFLNMLEFYESIRHFEIEMNFDDDDTWRCFCNACSNIMVLESLSFRKMVLNEPYMRSLINTIKNNPNITMLKFDSCMLVKLPNFYLIESLMTNRSVRELYLPSTGLYTKEAEILARFLINNTHLKVLDISNNFIGDRGLECLAKGLCQQDTPGVGLSALSIFNNQISEKSGPIISNIIVKCKNLHTLNIGYNNLTDEVLIHISGSLPSTVSLEGLGFQCTLLTCKGINVLAEAIQNNKSLQKINLKGNKAIQINGVESLCQALTKSKIYKIEIDETNRSCNDPEAYSQLVKKLFAICTVNKSYADNSDDEELVNISQRISRKMSLSCEPRYMEPDPTTTFQIGSPAVSPVPSPVSSPAPKSRFQIVKVTEISSSCSSASASPSPSPSPKQKSRFRVTRVPPSPDEEVSLGRFANVRSSVSSNDSMDSLATLHLDSDSD
ncbi:hypothetical protein NQ315_010224 [Exocentrus adspersus]|uniref:Protein phosphatase 1 regulatory subunit 37 n=1 Tax=Exocentrus adspersus TaxID=1586481 RepID=A0AAV8WAT6_9CUCU|nr:hypothetical protein NQ315_010224 [Exocentrus adspersus]